MARLVGLTSVGVAKRVHMYLRNAKLCSVHAMLSPDGLRPTFSAFVDLTFAPPTTVTDIQSTLRRMPEVAGAWTLWEAGMTRVHLATDAAEPIATLIERLRHAGLHAQVRALALVREETVPARGPQITALDLSRANSTRALDHLETDAA